MPSAILFDLDDTILECEGGDHLKLWMKSVQKHIHLFAHLNPESFFKEICVVANEFWSDPQRHRFGRLDMRTTRQNLVFKAAVNLKHPNKEGAIELANYYHNKREFNVTPFPGAIETLNYFRETPIKLALITNGSAEVQRSKIDKYNLEQFFDLILIEGEFGMGKPNPEVYSHITNQLGVTPEESWIVGDNLEWEVQAPEKLGFFTIWNDYRREGLPKSKDIVPDMIVNNISELVKMVKANKQIFTEK